MTAVGEVIANRARKRQMPPRLVVQEAHQVSPLNRVKPHELVLPYETMPLYREAMRIANTVIQTAAELPGLAAGADHFEDIRAPIPRWACGRRPVAISGGHRFWLLRVTDHHSATTGVANPIGAAALSDRRAAIRRSALRVPLRASQQSATSKRHGLPWGAEQAALWPS